MVIDYPAYTFNPPKFIDITDMVRPNRKPQRKMEWKPSKNSSKNGISVK